MSKTSKTTVRLECLKLWMAENKLPKPKKQKQTDGREF